MGLRVLLTGEPKVGKSTIIHRSLESVSGAFGFWTTELRKNNQRYGFMVEDDRGRTVLLSSVYLLTTDYVGRYRVDVASFDHFLRELGKPTPSQLIYIDEIGRMQTLSDNFQTELDNLMMLSNTMIGTIAKDAYDPIIGRIKDDPETVVIEVSVDNRDDVLTLMKAVVESHNLITKLDSTQYNRFVFMVHNTTDLTLLYKLFHNTLSYVTNGKVNQKSDETFEVSGFTSNHHLHKVKNQFVCDCPIYSQKQMCSHIFAVQLLVQIN